MPWAVTDHSPRFVNLSKNKYNNSAFVVAQGFSGYPRTRQNTGMLKNKVKERGYIGTFKSPRKRMGRRGEERSSPYFDSGEHFWSADKCIHVERLTCWLAIPLWVLSPL